MKHPTKQTAPYYFPSQQMIEQLKPRTFRTLHEAINLVHQAARNSEHSKNRYCLKSFNGRDMHFLQCTVEGCQSHILMKSRKALPYKKSGSTKIATMQFQFYKISNQHQHFTQKRRQANDCQEAQNQQISQMKVYYRHDCQRTDPLQYLKYSLRKHNISMHFRDFINCFITQKDQDQNKTQLNLPYHLPQIFKFQQIQVSLRASYKCLNQKKKTYFYIIQVEAFDQVVTQVKFIASNKTRNPQNFLYILVLIYILLNDLKNCEVLLERQMWVDIRSNLSQKDNWDSIQRQQRQFMDFIVDLEKMFFLVNDQIFKSNKTKQPLCIINQNLGHCRKQNYQQNQQMEEFNVQNIRLSIKQLQPLEYRSIKNKIFVAQGLYKQATIGNAQWRMNEEKPSILRKLNNLFDRQQMQRITKQKEKEKASHQQDNNIVSLIESQQEEQMERQERDDAIRSYMQSQEKQHLKHALDNVDGDDYWGGLVADKEVLGNRISQNNNIVQQSIQLDKFIMNQQ